MTIRFYLEKYDVAAVIKDKQAESFIKNYSAFSTAVSSFNSKVGFYILIDDIPYYITKVELSITGDVNIYLCQS